MLENEEVHQVTRNLSLKQGLTRWLYGGGLRPVAAVALLLVVFVFVPNQHQGTQVAHAASANKPTLVSPSLQCDDWAAVINFEAPTSKAVSNYEYFVTSVQWSSGGTDPAVAAPGTGPGGTTAVWTALSPAQTTSPMVLSWNTLSLTSTALHYFYVRAVYTDLTTSGSWWQNQPGCSGKTSSAAARVPYPPTSLVATAGSGSASIAFTQSNLGTGLTNYKYSTDGVNYIALSPADTSSPVTIPSLTPGVTYTIYLKAVNSVGDSVASSSVNVVPVSGPPTVTSISPTSGTTAGGTSVTITGTNFIAGATVTIGGSSCTSVVIVSSTSITCITPSGTAGAQDVVVATGVSPNATLTGGFTYVAPPAAPATPDLATASDSGSSSTDDITSDNTPTISVGSATNGNTVTVTATKSGQTNVTCTFAATAQTGCDLGTLIDGVWSVTAKQTNSGIDSAETSALSITVDATPPTVTSFSSTKSNGTYGIGTTVNITATLSEAVADGASITVTLDTGDTVVLTKATSTTLTGTYTVGTGDNSADLTVTSYALTSAPTDAAGNAMTSTTLPTGANNIAGAQAIVIDTTAPTLSSATANTAGTQVTLTFNEALNATTAVAGDFVVTVGITTLTVSAIAVSGSTVILTLGTPANTGDAISVAYTAPSPNSATSNSAIQDTAGNDAISFTTTATVPSPTTTVAPSGGGGSGEPEPTTTTTTLPTTTTTSTTTTTTTTTVAPVATTTTTVAPRVRKTTTTTAAAPETTAFVPLAPLLTVAPTTTVAVDSGSPGSTALPVQFTEPNPRIPVIETEVVKIADGVGSVAGMAPDGWVKVEPVGASSVVLTTSDGLLIEIAALTNENKSVRLNSRGMVIVEHDDYITVAGGGLQPNSDASTWLFSTPKELGQLKVDANGEFTQRYQIGPDVHVGDHTAQVNGIAPDGTLRSVEVGVEVIARPAVVGPYKPRSEPKKVIDLTVEAMVFLAALGAVASRKEERESGDLAEVSVSFRVSNTDDRSDTLHPPVLPILDRLSFDMPTRVVQKSPMIARVFADGAYLRALIGWLWVAMPLLGVIVGVLAARDTNYEVVMPSLALIATLMVIGIFDSFAGFIAVAVFAVLANFHSAFNTTDSVRGILGIWVLAFAVSLAGSAMRPFRRLASGSLGVWQRATDFVLITLFGAWVAGAMFSALPALTGIRTVDADRIGVIRVVALLALAARYALENTARILTPSRLTKIENQQLPEVPERQKLVSAIVRTSVFMFVALVFIGNNWALWLGGLLYLAPKLIGLIDERFPDFNVLHRYLPRGIFKIVLMLFVAKWWGGLVADNVPNPDEMVQYGFVLLGIPGLVLTVFGWFGRSSNAWPSTLASKLLGIALLIVALVTVL